MINLLVLNGSLDQIDSKEYLDDIEECYYKNMKNIDFNEKRNIPKHITQQNLHSYI